MGVSGVAELKAADNEVINAQRHTLEAKRQKKNKDEAYDKLVEALEGQRTSKDAPHKYDLKYLSKLRTQYVQAALKEAAHLRAAQRQSPLSSAQILQATNDMYDSLKELSTRYVAKPVKETVVTRVNKLQKMQEQLAALSKQDYAKSPALTAKRDALIADINKLVESQQKPIRNKIKAKQQELVRLRDQMERYRNSELEPARQKWLAMPEGPVGSQAYIARDQMQQRYLLRKKKFDGYADHDSRVTQDITDLMKRLDEPRLTRGRKLKDVRPASQRPFADRKKAVETIKEQLEAAEAALLAKPERKRVEVSEIERRQGLLAQIKEKEDQLAALKNKQGENEARAKLTKEIAALDARYKKQQAELGERQKAPEIPTSFKERRDEAAELETQIKEAFAAKDYDKTAKLLARMQQLDLGEDLASELGTDLEYNQRVLERAIKDTQGELDALVNIPPGKEVKVGQKVPRRGLSEEQQQQLKQLNKRMEALQKSLAQNQASLDDIGLFAAKGVDTTTEDLFAPTAEQGVIFETPEQFLGSSKYGKIAKLRKDLARVVNTMPVSFEDLQKARTDYVTALSALEKLRKTPDATQFNYYGELSGQYAIQAENMRKKAMESAAAGNKTSRAIGNIQDKEATRLQAKADLYEKMANNAKLLDISKYSTELQQVVVEAKLAGLNIEEDSREIGLSMAQKNVERLKTAMNDMDELARKNGTTTPIVKEKPEDIPEGDALQKQIGSVNKQIAAVRKRMESEEPDQRTQSQYEIQGLLGYRQDLETEQFMRTAEGRLYQLKQSFLEEYSADIDPTDPMKTALGRAIARSREYIPETAAKDAEKLEELLKSQKEVSDALAKYKAAAPSDEDVAKNYWMGRFEVAKLEEDLAKLNDSVAEAQARITAAQDAEVQMLRRADSALKDAWAKVKAAEKALTYKDEKQANDLAKRRKALILTQKALDDAKETSRLKAKAQQERIQTGAGIPSTKVTRVKTIHKTIRSVVKRQTQYRHIVCIHDTVTETHHLPIRHQQRCATDDRF
jgi:DNA repair exonuclease SbcCD ATPase subunit